MAAGPPRPRPWPQGVAKTVGADGVERLTAPDAWGFYSGAVGYHLPVKLTSAEKWLANMQYIR